jgi:malonyl-CoA O-methyltransferase
MSSLAETERLPQEPRVLSVDKGYELWAPTYDQDLNPLLALEERVLTPLLPSLQGKVVLDLGCGTGRWLKRLLESGASEGAGLDASSAMLAPSRIEGLAPRAVGAR